MEPNPVTFVGVNACAMLGALEEGKHVHEHIVRCGFELNVSVGSTLTCMYAKCGSIEDARRVFNKMPTHNVVAWNAMISGHLRCGQGYKALELFQQMQYEGMMPDRFTFVQVSMHVPLCKHLKKAGASIHRSYKVAVSWMSMWPMALLTCMPNARACRMLRRCLTGCLYVMCLLGML